MWGEETGSSSFMKRVQGLSGKPLCLPKPSLKTGARVVIWEVKLSSESQKQRILTWRQNPKYVNWTLSHFKDRLTAQDYGLLLQPALSKDSGTYFVEVTDNSGIINKNEVVVTVLGVFWVEEDPLLETNPVGDPYMWVLFKDRNTSCQLVLNCSAEADNVIVSWYRDDVKLKESSGSSAQVVQSVLANSSHVYSCNVSATLSWAHRSFSLTPGCVVSVGSPGLEPCTPFHLLAWELPCRCRLLCTSEQLILECVLLSTITFIFLWRKRGRTGQTDACNQEIVEQSLPVSQDPCLVQSNYAQCSVSTPPESESMTLYSMVQLSQIGELEPGAQNPARLSRKELQNFKMLLETGLLYMSESVHVRVCKHVYVHECVCWRLPHPLGQHFLWCEPCTPPAASLSSQPLTVSGMAGDTSSH
ncbi:natural killer cell receptor 2B4 [Suncus etruscus]|uniref:natural killer cell receptor 2B4 n=1 Tax=Suncus etruscus TaxID=109475 RepID=UPI002110580B|nr:natural killer cell receptor 2B4 [Suncus etruscus]